MICSLLIRSSHLCDLLRLWYIINRLQIQFFMDNLKKEEAPVAQSQVTPYGVFQITQDGKVVDYGLGVTHTFDKLITFKKYFNQGRKLGRIFFKKLTQGQQFPLSFDLSEANLPGFVVTIGQVSKDELKSDIFVNITLDIDIEGAPRFLPTKSIDSIDLGKRGYAIGFDKSEGDLFLHKTTYQLDSHIMNLRLKQQSAILFVFRGDKDYCYGFYEEQGDKNLGYDLYLSQEFLAGKASQNESFIKDNKVDRVFDPFGKVPFQSIGILNMPGGYGTAQLLRNKGGCKYLITCAHNFIGSNYNYLNTLKEYTFKLPFYDIHKPMRYVMQQVPKFKIKKVYIPKKYSAYFDPVQPVQYNKQAVFPAIGANVPRYADNISIKTFYDIAVIELEENLDVSHGFAIEDERPITGPVQVAGFPTSRNAGRIFGIKAEKMYTESTASHPNDPSYVRLSEESGGDIIMMHKLSTLSGNSGSAIYERISESECRLLAIHTTGYGPNVNFRWNPNPKKEELYGTHNYGTYIYSPNIKSWLNSVFNP